MYDGWAKRCQRRRDPAQQIVVTGTAKPANKRIDTSQYAKYDCRKEGKAFSLSSVHVISKSAWRQAVAADHTLESAISEWHKIANNAEWRTLADVKKVYPGADRVGPYTVFNIKGNKYRLIVKIEYRWQMIFVKNLLSHADYDQGDWK